ncbi:MAG: class I SAM-dependent methyltransferase [Candidatus Nanoarchaeia archaeon]
MKKLNLGAGDDIKKSTSRETWVNQDWIQLPGIDVVANLNKKLPFKTNEFDEVFCSHVLEHVDDLIFTMNELHRITKPKGRVIIRGPHFSSGVSYWDPTHKRFFSYFTFDFFTKKTYYETPRFRIVKRKLNFTRMHYTFLNKIFNPFINFNPTLYERFFCWIFPTSEVVAELEVDK